MAKKQYTCRKVSRHSVHDASDDFKARHIMLGVPVSCTACRFFQLRAGIDHQYSRAHVMAECTNSQQMWEDRLHLSYSHKGDVGNPFAQTLRAGKCPEFTLTRPYHIHLIELQDQKLKHSKVGR